MFSRLKSESRGSAPLEMVALVSLLLVPIGPMLLLFEQISDQLAAESIARHGLRYAFIISPLAANPSNLLESSLTQLATSWEKELESFSLQCLGCEAGGLLELRVQVGNAVAIQSAGIEPE